MLTFSSYAQKRNNLYVGINFDNLVNSMDVGDDFFAFENKFVFSFGYERLIGNHIALSLTTGKYISGGADNVNRYSGTGGLYNTYLPEKSSTINYNGIAYSTSEYVVNDASFTLNNKNYFKYESKYFFNEFDADGKTGGYMAANYSKSTFLASIGTVGYSRGFNAPWSYPDNIDVTYKDEEITINRVGVKFGLAYADGTGSDISAGFDINIPNRNETWNLPVTFRTVSFNVNWIWFIPF